MRNFSSRFSYAVACPLVVLTFLIGGCKAGSDRTGRDYMPDMRYPQSYETYDYNPNFEGSTPSPQPVAGTIPRGKLPENAFEEEDIQKSFLFQQYYPATPDGYEAAGNELKNPLELNDANLKKGKAIYDIYCLVCHGEKGDGDGSIVQSRAFPPVPAYSERLAGLSEGKMFHSITYGRNLMGSYASQVSAEDRWKVIYYIQKMTGVGPFAKAAEVNSDTIQTMN